ncbi:MULTISPECIES: tautomerase family protein [unclassified Vibrio]|uniref:Tautomerase family protein n=1 Tax=Vibrio sp. HB236076 TaxID=3232307 RepID=A0AB39HDI4_9VIBR|nr:tautomerase family protein [Vibrio sp. HB161653]MDP5255179.1 tautomerase family protein [Vibrio sp. HB161653]
MPLLQFDLIEGRSESDIKAILDVAHQVVLDVFKVPERDRYQIVTENKARNMIFEDTGLGFSRSEKFIMLRVFTSPRPEEQKFEFMRVLAERLEAECGIEGNDLMIGFFSNTRNDWSFGFGEAQYHTGKL